MNKFQVKIKVNKQLKLILIIFNKIILVCLKKIIYYNNLSIKCECNQVLIYK